MTARKLIVAATLFLAVGWTAGVVAQNVDGGAISNGALTPLVAEIRQLRLAVEESARAQNQTQALATYLSAQQIRLSQLSGQHDDARREVESLQDQLQNMSRQASQLEEQGMTLADANQRVEFDRVLKEAKRRVQQVSTRLQATQAREAELAQLTQAEETRWSELVARLEQSTRR